MRILIRPTTPTNNRKEEGLSPKTMNFLTSEYTSAEVADALCDLAVAPQTQDAYALTSTLNALSASDNADDPHIRQLLSVIRERRIRDIATAFRDTYISSARAADTLKSLGVELDDVFLEETCFAFALLMLPTKISAPKLQTWLGTTAKSRGLTRLKFQLAYTETVCARVPAIRIYFDMDGTLAEWRNVAIEAIYEKGYYASLCGHENVIGAANVLSENGFSVCVLSAYLTDSEYALAEKKAWCDKNVPFIPEGYRVFCPTHLSKADAVGKLTKYDILVDDYSANLHQWVAAGGRAVKVMNHINGNNGTWTGPTVDISDRSEDIASAILFGF